MKVHEPEPLLVRLGKRIQLFHHGPGLLVSGLEARVPLVADEFVDRYDARQGSFSSFQTRKYGRFLRDMVAGTATGFNGRVPPGGTRPLFAMAGRE